MKNEKSQTVKVNRVLVVPVGVPHKTAVWVGAGRRLRIPTADCPIVRHKHHHRIISHTSNFAESKFEPKILKPYYI